MYISLFPISRPQHFFPLGMFTFSMSKHVRCHSTHPGQNVLCNLCILSLSFIKIGRVWYFGPSTPITKVLEYRALTAHRTWKPTSGKSYVNILTMVLLGSSRVHFQLGHYCFRSALLCFCFDHMIYDVKWDLPAGCRIPSRTFTHSP